MGGGITGLAAAFRIREMAAAREKPVEVTVLEAGAHPGGALRTVLRDGFVIETGADSFLRVKPAARELAVRLGLEAELIGTNPRYRSTMVVRGGRLTEIPSGFSLLAPAYLMPVIKSSLFSWPAKLRIMAEPLIPRRRAGGDESLAAFVTRRLGKEVLDRVAQPLAGGIYTADPDQLGMRATMARFVEMEHRYGSVIRGLRAAAGDHGGREASGARWSLFLSLRGGMQTLADALARRLEGNVRKAARVTALRQAENSWRLELAADSLDADAVILAIPAHEAARLIRPLRPRLAALLAQIPYASAATVNMAYREQDFPRPFKSFGFVVPRIERRRIIAASFSSLKFEGRAPQGKLLARAFVGGVLQSAMMDLTDDEMAAAAREEFADLLGVAAAPGFTVVERWKNAMPQYAVGHLEHTAKIEGECQTLPRLALAGSAYRGVGIPDCIKSGEQAAEAVLSELTADG